MIHLVEQGLRALRRWISRSELSLRILRLPVSRGTGDQPGLLLIQIDGLSRRELERALLQRRMPFLKSLLARQSYELLTLYSGLPSTTPAVQGELHYGVCCTVPAFTFLDARARAIVRMLHPETAQDVEARLRQHDQGLLRDGSSWSNIYTGGAAARETHFCAATNEPGLMIKSGALPALLGLLLLQFGALLRLITLTLVEIGLALYDVVVGIGRGEKVWEEVKFVGSRLVVGVGLREAVTVGAKIDLARGLSIVHLNFLGYDEHGHRRGPDSVFAHWTLRGIDRAIKRLYRAAQRSARRDYEVWIFSDHGQERVRSYYLEFPGGIEKTVAELLNLATDGQQQGLPPSRSSRVGRNTWLETRRRLKARAPDALSAPPPFAVVADGTLGHLYLGQPLAADQRAELAQRLVTQGHVPGAIYRDASEAWQWVHPAGRVPLKQAASLLPHPAGLAEEVLRDLERVCEHPSAGEIVLLGWKPGGQPWSFSLERGAHGCFGPHETQGFALLPVGTRLPPFVPGCVRPLTLRQAALHLLGRRRLPRERGSSVVARPLRVLSYNVHSCCGMDGRISACRIARVIDRYQPDIVAVQELDRWRVRTGAQDQARWIAEELEMHMAFCPALVCGREEYGHALFSREPLEVMRCEVFHSSRRWTAREPRAALWARLRCGPHVLHIINTHLGLGRIERLGQMNDLLSQTWLGGIAEEEPVILCGDFNMRPGSLTYRALTQRLLDTQGSNGKPAALTFMGRYPFMRLDYIFVSNHFRTEQVRVPRDDLTCLASDHLPLIADLVFKP